MRIGIDIRSLAAGRRTGVEEYTIGLLRELFQHTEHEYVLFFNAWNNLEPDLSWTLGYEHVSIRRFRIPNLLLNLSLWYLRYPKLDQLLGGVDVFFMPNLNFAAFSKTVKVVVTAHDLSFEIFPETFAWKQRLWHYAVNFRSLLSRADAIVAVSHSTRDDLVTRYHLPEGKISVIHSGIDERFRIMDRNDLALVTVQKKYHLPYRFILYLGTIEPRKNLESLVRAFEAFQRGAVGEEMTKYELVLAGRPGWKYEELFSLIRNSPAKEKIRVVGFIDDADKPALYNLASVFVYPSFYEGFGFPPLEALASGIPVIASHSASLPEVVGDAGILIDPYRPDEILQALRSIIADKDYRYRLHERSRVRRVAFTWQRTGREFVELLKTVVAS